MRRSALAVAALCALAASASAGIVLRVAPRELADTAHLVVEGRVLSVQARWDAEQTTIDTWISLAVDRVHKGPAGLATATARVPGGTVGDHTVQVDGVARFEEGEEVVVFLWKDSLGTYQVLGEGQGKFRVFRDRRSGARMVENSLAGLCLMVRGGAAGLGDPALRRPDRLPYDDLAAIVRDSVAGLPKDPVRDRAPGTVVAKPRDPEVPVETPAQRPEAPATPVIEAPATGGGAGTATTDPETTGADTTGDPAATTGEPTANAPLGTVAAVREDGTLRLSLAGAAPGAGTWLLVLGAEDGAQRALVRVLETPAGEAIRAEVVARPEGAAAPARGDVLRAAPAPEGDGERAPAAPSAPPTPPPAPAVR